MMLCLFQGLLSLVYLTSSDMYALINYVSFVNWLAIGLSVTVLLYFRYTRPEMPRPIKVSKMYSMLTNISFSHINYLIQLSRFVMFDLICA